MYTITLTLAHFKKGMWCTGVQHLTVSYSFYIFLTTVSIWSINPSHKIRGGLKYLQFGGIDLFCVFWEKKSIVGSFVLVLGVAALFERFKVNFLRKIVWKPLKMQDFEIPHTEVEWAEAVEPSEDSSSNGADGYNLSDGFCWMLGDPSCFVSSSSSSSSVLTSACKKMRH